MPEEDDQASVNLLESLERPIRNGLTALERIEEFRERRRHDAFLLDVQNEAARNQRCVVPFAVIDARRSVAVEPKPRGPRLFGDQPCFACASQCIEQISKGYGAGWMKLAHFEVPPPNRTSTGAAITIAAGWRGCSQRIGAPEEIRTPNLRIRSQTARNSEGIASTDFSGMHRRTIQA